MLDFDTILYFAYMDSYEKEDKENRSTEKKDFERGEEPQNNKIRDE